MYYTHPKQENFDPDAIRLRDGRYCPSCNPHQYATPAVIHADHNAAAATLKLMVEGVVQ